MKIVSVEIDKIKEYNQNAKQHDTKQINLIAESIKRFGWQQPIVLDKNNEIVAGHGRILGAKKLELKEVPCLYIENLTEDEIKAYRLADNQINALTGFDNALLIPELQSLPDDLFDLTGFDRDLIIEADAKDDEVPETPEEPKSKLGDLYELGNHRVLCGDSLSLEDINKLSNGVKVDMLITDPPYNVAYEGATKEKLTIKNDSMGDSEFLQFLKDAYIGADSIMKAGAVFYIWHADSEGFNFRAACKDVGWTVRQCLIWVKNSAVMGRQDYHWKHEPCLYGWKEGASHLWNADRKQTTILNFDKPNRNGEHPTMKPVELFVYQITNNTKGEDIVLDTFLGSGTTLIASEKTGRTCYGMELDPKYVDVIIQRYVDYTGNENIKLNGENIIWKKKN